jgi:ABC-type transport system involved in cytochrome bd biosynthesis fused ATPase/permease subunit
MNGGRIQDVGNHSQLYANNPDYAEMFQQFENLPPIPDEMLLSSKKIQEAT